MRRGVLTGGSIRQSPCSPSRGTWGSRAWSSRRAGRYTTANEYRDYLERYAAHHGLVPRRAEVERVERAGDRFRVHFLGIDGSCDYEIVIAATGMFDHPVSPEIPGLPLGGLARPRVTAGLPRQGLARTRRPGGSEDPHHRGGHQRGRDRRGVREAQLRVVVAARRGVRLMPQHILGVSTYGLADSLASRLPRWVVGSHCGNRRALPCTERGFRRFRRKGLISVRGPIACFEGTIAVFTDGSREPFDAVVLATGYRFTTPFLPAEVAPATTSHRFTESGESPSWPGLYFVGFRCARSLNSEFLRGIAQDAPAIASHIRERLARNA